MRLATRRGEAVKRLTEEPEDHHLTPALIARLKDELIRLEGTERGEAVSEVRRLAEMGDFSENAGYQIAKGTLRRINNRIETLKERIRTAIPIEQGTDASGKIKIGSTVVLEMNGKQITFEVLGSQETNPSRGRISHHSPLGRALIGQSTGDIVRIPLIDSEVVYRILEVR